MRSVLNNPELEKEFTQNGFVVIRQCMPAQKIAEARQLFDSLGIETGHNFMLTNLLSDLQLRNKIHEGLRAIFVAELQGILHQMKYVLGTLAVKPVGASTGFALHQDWSLVNEEEFRSCSVWIPLSDVNEQNGCFRQLPGSCQTFGEPRGMNIPFLYQDYSNEISERYMQPLPMQAGDVLVFDHRLVHDSMANEGMQTRVAAALAFIPQEAALNHYYHDKSTGQISLYQLPENFLIENDFYNYSQPPAQGVLLRQFGFKPKEVSREEFVSLQ